MDAFSVPALLARAELTDKDIRKARASAYPQELWGLLAACIVVIAFCQLTSWLLAKYTSTRPSQAQPGDAEAGRSSTQGHVSWRRLPLAIVNVYRVVAFRWTLNFGDSFSISFAELFLTCGYIIAVFTWTFINTTDLEGEKLNIKFWDNRSGHIAASQLPLITALGTRNNALSYITGVSYDRLKFIHRMAARVTFVVLWTHGVVRLVELDPSKYPAWFVPIGIVAMVAFTYLLIVSVRPIRARAYEFFYYSHVISVVFIIFGGFFHAEHQKFGYYVWPCFIIWGLDRVIRLGRLVFYNHLYFGFSSKANQLDASVELLSPHLVRLHLKRPPHFRWTPGQTAFLTMPSVSGLPIESHPFTIASVDSRYALADTTAAAEPEKSGVNDGDSDKEARLYWNELVFLIHVREGYTRRLANMAEVGQKVRVLVDGPYGFSPDLDSDDAVVLIAGSSGVSYTLATFLGALSRIKSGKSSCRKLVFIWCIRDASHMAWVSKALTRALELAPADVDIAVRIFVTRRGAPGLTRDGSYNEEESIHSEGSDKGKSRAPSLLNFPVVQVAQGRPDLAALIHEQVEANTGRLSFTVCGSEGIARACREALRLPLSTALKGGPSVVLHVESFGYA